MNDQDRIKALEAENARLNKDLVEIKCELAIATQEDNEKPIVTIRRLSYKLRDVQKIAAGWHMATIKEEQKRFEVQAGLAQVKAENARLRAAMRKNDE